MWQNQQEQEQSGKEHSTSDSDLDYVLVDRESEEKGTHLSSADAQKRQIMSKDHGHYPILPAELTGTSMASYKEAKWPFIVNLSNSIVGVSILAMPFCLQQCGILLGIAMLVLLNLLTRLMCYMLMHGAYTARCRSYEYLALYAFGWRGKKMVEISIIMFLMSTLCAFFVVIGDIGPHVLAEYLQLAAPTQRIRVFVMVVTTLFFILPLSLLRNFDSLSAVSSIAIVFYGIFVIRMLIECLPRLLAMKWIDEVNWWRAEGALQCLPIVAMALSCQTQLFVVAECMPDATPLKMDQVVSGALNLCSVLYAFVGLFGYVAFHDVSLHGDVLVFLQPTLLTQLLKLCFMLSVAVSVPIMLFPCRAAIFNLISTSTPYHHPHSSNEPQHVDIVIPENPFRLLTILILLINLIIAIWIPNVEFVLGLTGSLIGSTICIICPAVIFISVAPTNATYARLGAKLAIVIGVLMLVLSTSKILSSQPKSDVLDQPIPKLPDNPAVALDINKRQAEINPKLSLDKIPVTAKINAAAKNVKQPSFDGAVNERPAEVQRDQAQVAPDNIDSKKLNSGDKEKLAPEKKLPIMDADLNAKPVVKEKEAVNVVQEVEQDKAILADKSEHREQ